MRILLLTTDIYGGYGGIALYNRDLAAAIAAMPECEELVVLPRIIPRAVTEPIPGKVTFLREAAGGRLAYLRTLGRVSRQHFDLVICGHIHLLPLAKLLGQAPVLFVYGIEAWRPPAKRAAAHLVKECRRIVSISEITRDRLLQWSGYAGPTSILPNAIHAEQFGLRTRRPDLVRGYRLEGKRVLLTVGRLVASERYKGFDEVMEALPALPEDVVYLIAGGGNDAPRLQLKARALGVADRVRFTGEFAEADKPDLFALADVYVMPSRGEGFGFVFLEALASGVPAIGSCLDGGREALLGGELGRLVDPTNPAELTIAIEEALAFKRGIPAQLDHFLFARFRERAHATLAYSLAE